MCCAISSIHNNGFTLRRHRLKKFNDGAAIVQALVWKIVSWTPWRKKRNAYKYIKMLARAIKINTWINALSNPINTEHFGGVHLLVSKRFNRILYASHVFIRRLFFPLHVQVNLFIGSRYQWDFLSWKCWVSFFAIAAIANAIRSGSIVPDAVYRIIIQYMAHKTIRILITVVSRIARFI